MRSPTERSPRGSRTKVAVALSVLLGIACIQAPVRVDVTTEATERLVAADSFALVVPGGARSSVGERIEEELRTGLVERGLREVPPGEAALAVSYRVTRQSGRRLAPVPNAEGGDLSAPQDYTEKTIEIDMVDPRTEELLWRGVGEIDVVTRSSEPQAAAKVIREVLERYPRPVL